MTAAASTFPFSRAEARVGPNAIIQIDLAIRRIYGVRLCRDVFAQAGLPSADAFGYRTMVPVRDATRLFLSVYETFGPGEGAELLRIAGTETANYLLANRIPRSAQRLLKALPHALAARFFLKAIAMHAWTFAGSGEVRCRYGRRLMLEIENNPLAAPGCP